VGASVSGSSARASSPKVSSRWLRSGSVAFETSTAAPRGSLPRAISSAAISRAFRPAM
jgi:hypothetical protein